MTSQSSPRSPRSQSSPRSYKPKKSIVFRLADFNFYPYKSRSLSKKIHIIEFYISLAKSPQSHISIFHDTKMFPKSKPFSLYPPHNIVQESYNLPPITERIIDKSANKNGVWISFADLIPYGEVNEYKIPAKSSIYNHDISPSQINILKTVHNMIVEKFDSEKMRFATVIYPEVLSSWRKSVNMSKRKVSFSLKNDDNDDEEIFYLSLYHGANPDVSPKIIGESGGKLRASVGENGE